MQVVPHVRDHHFVSLAETGGDPLPYGLEPNRSTLEELLEHARAQHILTTPVTLEDVFVKSTLDLVG